MPIGATDKGNRVNVKTLLRLIASTIALGAAVVAMMMPVGGVQVADLIDPVDGFYRDARAAGHQPLETLTLPGMGGDVTIEWEARGVPHIYAAADSDAVRVLGFLVARDRLFQLEFVTRVAAGELSEMLGPDALPSDRFLRRTGMDLGAKTNLTRIEQEKGIEYDLLRWYTEGANSYVDKLDKINYPIEYKLLGVNPKRFSLMDPLRVMQYMAYDLSYSTRAFDYEYLASVLGHDFDLLYPARSTQAVPIVKAPQLAQSDGAAVREAQPEKTVFGVQHDRGDLLFADGHVDGKGSNNWAVGPSRSTTGAPILAGDMHLTLSLPAIWYEAHIVTPTMNAYGVTIPGAPLLVEAFTDSLAWAYTNTGTDQIDQLRIFVDENMQHYLYEGSWKELDIVYDTIRVKGEASVLDTLYYSHWGPTERATDSTAIATVWTGHQSNRALQSLWGMLRAQNVQQFRDATRVWDQPMQNILLVDKKEYIGIVSTGNLPIRTAESPWGVGDGSVSDGGWNGRVPFDELPRIERPAKNYVTSTNQEPVGGPYPYHQGRDWRTVYRSQRIDRLLSRFDKHSPEDLRRYQSDVLAVQSQWLIQALDTLLSPVEKASPVAEALLSWDGVMDKDSTKPLMFDLVMSELESLVWDEPVYESRIKPHFSNLTELARRNPESKWFDVQSTDKVEDFAAATRLALGSTERIISNKYGSVASLPAWGDEHQVIFKHVTQSDALRSLWRGPFPFSGYAETLSPGVGRDVTFSASWRMVVDMSTPRNTGLGIYPGGQSGNPMSRQYANNIGPYLDFEYHTLNRPEAPGRLSNAVKTVVKPGE